MKTLTIAGHKITLEKGQRYLASRPMVTSRSRRVYPVKIQTMDDGATVITIDGLSYKQANALINTFNNGAISLTGRVW